MGVLAFIIGVASTFLVEFIPISAMKSYDITNALDFLPIFSVIAFIPAVVGLILGIADVIKKSKTGEAKSLPMLGIILSSCSLAVILLFTVVILTINNESKIDSLVSRRVEEYWEEINGTTYLDDEDELEDEDEYYYDTEDEDYEYEDEDNEHQDETIENSQVEENNQVVDNNNVSEAI